MDSATRLLVVFCVAALAVQGPPRVVAYRVVEQRALPNGGYGKVVVIADTAANEKALRALGEELRYDTRADRNAFVWVYSSLKAAQLRHAVLEDRASAADLAVYDRHFVATYTRNANTGFHELEMTVKGDNGPVVTVKY